jgi:hypothetical protein
MIPSYLYISDNQMFVHNETGDHAIRSEVLETYLRKVRDSANRNEWKRSGSGAQFTGTFQPGADAQSRVAAVNAAIGCLAIKNGELVYSIRIDDTAGIYRKFRNDHTQEGIVISSGDTAYHDFDYNGGRLGGSAAFAGEGHIGVLEEGRRVGDMYTDGPSWDSEPVWSRVNPSEIYFSSAGLAVKSKNEKNEETPTGVPYGVYRAMIAGAARPVLGPSAICLMNIQTGTMQELLTDPDYDFLHPQSALDGSLYYVRRPYKQKSDNDSVGCLVDILLFPFRMIRALFGFFNFFSVKYSGKTLSNAGDVKRRDEEQMWIDGNFIQAEKELKENRNRGDKNPVIIPRTWELHRRCPDGTDTLVRRGVVAYRLMQNGDVLVSNGSAVLCLKTDGSEQKISSAERVTYLNV